MKINKLEFNNVDTSYASEQFSNMIVESDNSFRYKTYFLNGKWGSGKTTFLIESENNPNGALKKGGWSVKYLKLWELKDDRSVLELAFRVLLPPYYFCLWIFVLFSISVSLLLTPAFDLGLSWLFNIDYFIGHIFKIILTIVALSVSIYQLLKLKSDYIFIILFEKLLKSKRRKIVLVIDDFDRLSYEKQQESYKLFNVLHGYIPIVFVGDLDNLITDERVSIEFLNKIIDKRIELPTVINPTNILRNYSNALLDLVKEHEPENVWDFQDFLDQEFKKSSRSFRELNQFIDLLNNELKKKEGRVRISQQIVIVYLYLFYPLEYKKLMEKYDFLEKEITNSTLYRNLKQPGISNILNTSDRFRIPLAFSVRPVSYFINDSIENLTPSEAENILHKIIQYPLYFKTLNSKQFELLYYINRKNFAKDELVSFSKKLIIGYLKNPDLIKLVNTVIDLLIFKFSEEPISFWLDITNYLSIPDRCYFYVQYRMLSPEIYKFLKDDVLEYIDSVDVVEAPASVAYILIEGEPLNFYDYKSQLKKIFNIDNENCKEQIITLLRRLDLYTESKQPPIRYSIKTEFGEEDVSDFSIFIIEEFFSKLKYKN